MQSNPMALITTHMLMITKSPALNSYTHSKLISQLSIQHQPLACLIGISKLSCPKHYLYPRPKSSFPFSLYYLSRKLLYFTRGSHPKSGRHSWLLHFFFIIHDYSTHQQILPNISIITTSRDHILTWVTTISYLDYAKILHLCLQFILNTATRVIPLKHKSIILLLYSKSSNGFPSYIV